MQEKSQDAKERLALLHRQISELSARAGEKEDSIVQVEFLKNRLEAQENVCVEGRKRLETVQFELKDEQKVLEQVQSELKNEQNGRIQDHVEHDVAVRHFFYG